MIVKVNDANLQTAAEIHAKSWRDSHAAFCSESFITQHTAERQKAFLEKEMQNGKQIYMLIKDIPVGIVSIQDSLIENLYILPSEQHKGYGTKAHCAAILQYGASPVHRKAFLRKLLQDHDTK